MRFLEPRMTVLDIGAHHGLYTLLASKKVGSQGHVVAFEPSPRELNRLRWHLRINRCRNVRVEPYALGRKEDLADLYVCTVHETGCNSLRPPNVAEPLSKVQVPVKVLDHYVEGTALKTVDFVKLDVEGGELDVLKGAEKHLVLQLRPLILCELADIRTEPWGYSSSEIYDFLQGRGYCWFSITPEGKLHGCPRKAHYHENLFAVPKEKIELIASFIVPGEQCVE